MAKEVIWSKRAIRSFDRIIDYLQVKWTEKEIVTLISNTNKVINQISTGVVQFRASNQLKIHEVLITKHNLLIYRVSSERIELLVFYDTRQHPKKKRI